MSTQNECEGGGVEFNPLSWTGRALRKAGTELLRRVSLEGVWIDVGAHLGETTLHHASRNPGLRIFAFEPNLRAAAGLMGRASNYVVIPMAVAEQDGHAEFHINRFDAASSLLPMSEEVRKTWVGGAALAVESMATVPTVRLDTFMGLVGIEKVDYLKIDAQGMDLAVIRSAGSRLRDISRIMLEVDLSPKPLCRGAAPKSEVLEFMCSAGFRLVSSERRHTDKRRIYGLSAQNLPKVSRSA
jgi:FkbM family methyltransferase